MLALSVMVAAAATVLIALLGTGSTHAATFNVTNTDDAGAGSLRQAIIDSNGAGSGNTIAFDIAGAGPHTIALATITES